MTQTLDLFRPLDGQDFACDRELQEAVLAIFNAHLAEMPPGYLYTQLIEWGRRQGWIRRTAAGWSVRLPRGGDDPMIETQNMPLGPYEPDEEAEADAGAMALAACLGTGAPGEPPPLDHLDALLAPEREWLESRAADFPEQSHKEQFASLEAVERLARELRAACGKAVGAEDFDPYADGYPPAAAGDPGPFPTCATCGDAGFVEDAEDGTREACPECGRAEGD